MHVVGAVIVHEGKILACRRASHKDAAGKWEFPGGKIEVGETSIEALVREILEELNMKVTCQKVLDVSDTEIGSRTIRLETILCTIPSAKSLTSSDHDSFIWLEQSQLWSVDWAAPDIPAVNKLVAISVSEFARLSLNDNY